MSPVLSLGSALLVAAQSVGADGDARAGGEPVAIAVSATVTVLRSAVIDFAPEAQTDGRDREARTIARQRRVDAAGTVWIDFS
jgi:hypothetical protein